MTFCHVFAYFARFTLPTIANQTCTIQSIGQNYQTNIVGYTHATLIVSYPLDTENMKH